MEYVVAKCSEGEGGSVTRIALDRLTDKAECPEVLLLLQFSRSERRDSTKV
jgi:hypothetical protein